MLPRVPLLTLSLVCLAALAPTGAAAASAKIPVVKTVKPLKANVGERLTITGRNFRSGRNRNTIIFFSKKGRAVFVKAEAATSRKITVTLPDRLVAFMTKVNGQPSATRFRIRVLARRLTAKFTPVKRSPVISPAGIGLAPGPAAPTAPACDPATLPAGADADGDLLSTGVERSLRTDPCVPDTDGDGVEDGYEYQSARDLNNVANPLPFPGKRPYANPLDPSDAGTDYDGDSLTQIEEFRLWATAGFGNHAGSVDALALNYSDGDQTSGATVATPTLADAGTSPLLSFLDVNHDGTVDGAELMALDFNASGTVSSREVSYMDTDTLYGITDGQGALSDEEKDADHDGLTNYDETHGRMTAGLWAAVYSGTETAYPVGYAAVEYMSTDSDGDGVGDGLDDQDFDGIGNLTEESRVAANMQDDGSPLATNRANGFINPFNPCLPHNWKFNPPNGRDCMRWPPLSSPPTPFESSRTDGVSYLNKF
jgi:hypothetical protein